MACGCVKRQKWLVKTLCKSGLTALCLRAQEKLAKMEAREQSK